VKEVHAVSAKFRGNLLLFRGKLPYAWAQGKYLGADMADGCTTTATFLDWDVESPTSISINFHINTVCSTSHGRLTYDYDLVTDQGSQSMTRNSIFWTASDGNNFILRDKITGTQGMTDVQNVNITDVLCTQISA